MIEHVFNASIAFESQRDLTEMERCHIWYQTAWVNVYSISYNIILNVYSFKTHKRKKHDFRSSERYEFLLKFISFFYSYEMSKITNKNYKDSATSYIHLGFGEIYWKDIMAKVII